MSPSARKYSTGEISSMNLTVFDPQSQKPQSTTSNAEPKISPSITSIGGAVLRSKTADFERMSSPSSRQQKKQSRSTIFDYSVNYSGTSGLTVSASTSTSTSVNENENDRTRRSSQGPIYKRQELISSAMKPKSK